jgi:ferredoxin
MKVKFVPQNVEFEIQPGESVMHVAQDHDLYIKSVCKGVPSCAECRVRVVEGDHNVLPPGSDELSLIGTGYFIDRRRLSCQLKCFGDITVDLSEQLAKQQGLIGGRKTKRSTIKDDRVEEQRAIRADEGIRFEGGEAPQEGQTVEQSQPQRQPQQQAQRPQPQPHSRSQQEQLRQQPQVHSQQQQRSSQPRAPQQQGQQRPNQEQNRRPNAGPNQNHNKNQNQGGQQPGPSGEGGGGRRRRRRRGGGKGGGQGPGGTQA